jgi:hypothetical protein
MIAMKTFRAVAAVLGVVLLTGCAVATPIAPPPGGFTARVVHVDAFGGFMIVEWPTGRSFVMVGQREAGNYHVGDTILLDSALRPLGRV